MRVALFVLAVLVAASAAPSQNEFVEIPPFRYVTVEPLIPPEEESGLGIINGREVVPHSIPYQVYLVGKVLISSWSCGGSLITPRFVLTAAHCIDGARSIEVTLGAHNLRIQSAGQITIAGRSWKLHEKYSSRTIDNDIGVIELALAVHLSATIQLARLPSLRDVGTNWFGQNGRVSGWGLTSGNGQASNVLLATNNTVMNNVQCNDFYGVVRSEEICLAGVGGHAACRGDSGGPMVIGNTQIGIVSYGSDGCLSGYPSVFVRITSFLDWIQINSDWRAS